MHDSSKNQIGEISWTLGGYLDRLMQPINIKQSLGRGNFTDCESKLIIWTSKSVGWVQDQETGER